MADGQSDDGGSPLSQALAAHQRGDGLFQVQLKVSELKLVGKQASPYAVSTQALHPVENVGSLLGEIEAAGWRLEHTGFVFAEHGSNGRGDTTSGQISTYTQGEVVGVYLFRRVEPAA